MNPVAGLCPKHMRKEHLWARKGYYKTTKEQDITPLLIADIRAKKLSEASIYALYMMWVQTIFTGKTSFEVSKYVTKDKLGFKYVEDAWNALMKLANDPKVVTLRANERARYWETCDDCKSARAAMIAEEIL